MATTTQNLGLIKPAGTDKIRIAQINSNMDILDAKMGPVGSTPLQTQATNAEASISALQRGLAIICNGNTHAAIVPGQYAYVRNHASLEEGLYMATAAIAANGALSTSNLAAVSGGGLNKLFEVKRLQNGTVNLDESAVLSEPITNFRFVLLIYRTNSDVKSQLLPTNILVGENLSIITGAEAASTSGTQSWPLQYSASVAVKFTDASTIKCTSQYQTNANWMLKLVSVYGISRK